jgi:hypothetical protein
MLLSKKQLAAMAPSIAHWAVVDAASGFLAPGEDQLVRLPAEVGPLYAFERALEKMAKTKSVKIPAWAVAGKAVPKDGRDGDLSWLVTELIWNYQAGNRYGPYTEATIELAATPKFGLLVDGRPAEELRSADIPSPQLLQKVEDLLNALIEKFATKEFRKQLRRRREAVAKQEGSALGILLAALACSNELMIVALDHALPGPVQYTAGGFANSTHYDPDAALQDLLGYRKQHMRRLNDVHGFQENLIGCIQFLCGGPVPGPYLHTVYLFRAGSMPIRHAIQELSSSWLRHTGGIGITHVTKSGDNFHKLPTGSVINLDRPESIKKFELELVYFTRKPLFFAPKLPRGMRAFWHSQRARPEESVGTVKKQRSARDRQIGTHRNSVDIATYGTELRRNIDNIIRVAANTRKPTEAEKFLADGGPDDAYRQYNKAKEMLKIAILQRVVVDREMADKDSDRHAAKHMAADENPEYMEHINSKTNRFSEHCRAAEPSEGTPDSAPTVDNIPSTELVASAEPAADLVVNNDALGEVPPSDDGGGISSEVNQVSNTKKTTLAVVSRPRKDRDTTVKVPVRPTRKNALHVHRIASPKGPFLDGTGD